MIEIDIFPLTKKEKIEFDKYFKNDKKDLKNFNWELFNEDLKKELLENSKTLLNGKNGHCEQVE